MKTQYKTRRSRAAHVALLLIALVAAFPIAANGGEEQAIGERPRIGLVLGGGGAKGLAHVGVLQVLEKYHVPVDAVTGTSMGAIIGALYASGYSTDEMEQIVRSIDWATIFEDKTERSRINFRRKQEDQDFLSKYKVSFEDGKLVLPEGLMHGQKLFLELSQQLPSYRSSGSFDELPIPFRAIAADLETGKAVVMKDGDLATAVFASMAVPGVIPPVERDGLVLIDGGIANNLPIDVARSMDVDIVIVVDVGARMKGREDLGTFLDVLHQMSLMLSAGNTNRQLSTLTSRDILIQPMLLDITAASFDKAVSAIKPGIEATEAVAGRLEELGLGEDSWRNHIASRKVRDPSAPTIDFVRVDQDSKLSDKVVANFIRAQPGEPLDIDELNEDIADLYGLGSFGRISYDIGTVENQRGLVVRAKENRAWRDYFRFGILLESDFESDANFQIGASYTKRNVNRAGGEWRSSAQIGGDQFIGTDFYQPFGPRLKFFLNPLALLIRSDVPLFDGGSTPIAEVRVSAAELGLDVGMQLGRWGELRLGAHKASGTIKPAIGDPGFDRISFDDSFSLVRFDIDTLDKLSFPRHGTFLRAQWVDHGAAASGEFSFDEYVLKTLTARSWNQNTLLLGAKFGKTSDANDGQFTGFDLGGFLNLSGLSSGQLFGPNMAYTQAVYYREVAKGSSLVKIPVYIGGSVEAGNVYDDLGDLTARSLILSGSIFVGVASPIGPIYVAGGLSENGDTAVYLFVGQAF